MLTPISRREFLKASGSLVVAFSFRRPACRRSAASPARRRKTVRSTRWTASSRSAPTARVTCYSGKVDLGTGVHTAIAQIVAEELTCHSTRSSVIQGDTLLTPDQGVTYGSLSIRTAACRSAKPRQLRARRCSSEAAKNARERERGRPRPMARMRSRRLPAFPTATLVGGKRLRAQGRSEGAAQGPGDYRIVGKPIPRIDIPAKVTGEFTYMQDFAARHAARARRAARGNGAETQSVDESCREAYPRIRQRRCATAIFSRWWRRPSGPRSRPRSRSRRTWSDVGRPTRQDEALGARARDQGRQGRRPSNVGNTADAMQHAANAMSARPTTSRSIPTARSGRHAPWPNSTTASSPAGPLPGRPTCCASSSRRCSPYRPRTCAASTSKAPDVTAATAMRMPRPTPR